MARKLRRSDPSEPDSVRSSRSTKGPSGQATQLGESGPVTYCEAGSSRDSRPAGHGGHVEWNHSWRPTDGQIHGSGELVSEAGVRDARSLISVGGRPGIPRFARVAAVVVGGTDGGQRVGTIGQAAGLRGWVDGEARLHRRVVRSVA